VIDRPSIVVGDDDLARCAWSAGDAEYRRYHDEEWGVALHGDRAIFEKISLEAFQAGLSWITILKRRDAFREVFTGFDIDSVAALAGDGRSEFVEAAMADSRIIRNRAKIEATIDNAVIVQSLVADHPGALDELLWSFAPSPSPRDGVPAPAPLSLADIPAVTAESTALSAALRGLGLRFVGPTTMYALMQSGGLVDDHVSGCWRATPGAAELSSREPHRTPRAAVDSPRQ
jgi:DNA-3-methyladenine glycosylase I